MQHSSGVHTGMAPTADSINHSYQRAFLSASRATFLLTQWKASFDQNGSNVGSANFDSRVLNEAVASTDNVLGSQNGMAFAPHGFSASFQPAFGGGFPETLMPFSETDGENNDGGTNNVEV